MGIIYIVLAVTLGTVGLTFVLYFLFSLLIMGFSKIKKTDEDSQK